MVRIGELGCVEYEIRTTLYVSQTEMVIPLLSWPNA